MSVLTDHLSSSLHHWLRGPRLDIALHGLLRLMALQIGSRPALRKLLRSRDGWLDFGVGLCTETGTVARSIRFTAGRGQVASGAPDDVDVTLRFTDDEALWVMLSSPPQEVMNLILHNRLRPVGSWSTLQLFTYLMTAVLGRHHQRLIARSCEEERRWRGQGGPAAPTTGRSAGLGGTSGRLRATSHEPGVRWLEDPYLSDYGLESFPRLRDFLEQHLTARAEVCAERAACLTDWHRRHGFETTADGTPWDPVERQGLVFAHLMAEKAPVIRRGDLLPGTTTKIPLTGSAVFPDAQGTMIWGELDSIGDRFLIPFDLSPSTRERLHHDIFPYWMTRTFRERVRIAHDDPACLQLGERWVAYFVWKSVGISHTVPDLESVLTKGTGGLNATLRARLADGGDDEARTTWTAMIRCLEGVETYAAHLAAQAAEQARKESCPRRRVELEEMASACLRVPREPAGSLLEAFTSIWIAWLALHNENADTGLSLGRLDQLLQPFFERDMASLQGAEERARYIEKAIELAGCFFLRCADHFPLTPDIANHLFGGASSNQALTLGGVTRAGDDAVNDMTYVLLKVTELLSPRDVNVNARFAPGKNSRSYLERLCEVNVLTAGTPSMHNDAAIFAALRPHGYSEEQLRDWSATGCVEPSISGEHMGHTGSVLMNLVAGLEMALHDGWHPLIAEQVGPRTGRLEDFADFEQVFDAWATQQRHLIAQAVELNELLAQVHAQHRPTPLLSALMRGPAQRGRDVTRGGARVNTSGTSNIGLADVTDSLLAIRQLVFEEGSVGLAELGRAIARDFLEAPELAALIGRRVRRFGSGCPRAVEMANRVARTVHAAWAAHTNSRGGPYTAGFWSMSQHVAYGNLSGALPSGRRAGKAFTPGLTPHPAASKSFLNNLRDVAELDPTSMDNNMAFNVKLVPSARDTCAQTAARMRAYVQTYFEMGGMQIQFNVVTAETLRAAMAHPEDHRGLLVRISGYNAYFVTLSREVQLELIERAEFVL